jgi:hypothetical protein
MRDVFEYGLVAASPCRSGDDRRAQGIYVFFVQLGLYMGVSSLVIMWNPHSFRLSVVKV